MGGGCESWWCWSWWSSGTSFFLFCFTAAAALTGRGEDTPASDGPNQEGRGFDCGAEIDAKPGGGGGGGVGGGGGGRRASRDVLV